MSKEEFEVFAEKYMDTIYRVAYSWTKNSDDANDVGRILRTFKIKKNVEVTDNGKDNF